MQEQTAITLGDPFQLSFFLATSGFGQPLQHPLKKGSSVLESKSYKHCCSGHCLRKTKAINIF